MAQAGGLPGPEGGTVGADAPHPGDEVLDVGGLEELQPAVLDERHAAAGELDLEQVAVVRGAHEHGLCPQRSPLVESTSRVTYRSLTAWYINSRLSEYSATVASIQKRRSRAAYACTGPITYVGQERVQADIQNLRHALRAAGRPMDDGFLTALSPTNVVPHRKPGRNAVTR